MDKKIHDERSCGLVTSGQLSSIHAKKIGIIAALPEEIAMLKQHVWTRKHVQYGLFDFVEGTFQDKETGVCRDIVYVLSNVGQVFASSVATLLLSKYEVDVVLFTGVAGGLREGHNIGDIVIARDVVNYDMDVTKFTLPFDPSYKHQRGELPFLKWPRCLPCDPRLVELASAAPAFAEEKHIIGRIATGSEFVDAARKKELKPLWEELGNPDVVEMEGAAVAHICKAFGDVPFLLLRAVSDTLTGDCSDDFNVFAVQAANEVWPILRHVIMHIAPHPDHPSSLYETEIVHVTGKPIEKV